MNIQNKTRKQNYEQNVLLSKAMCLVTFDFELKNDVVKVKVNLEKEKLFEVGFRLKYLFNTPHYYILLRELQSKLIEIPHLYYTPKGIKKLINDFSLKNIEQTKFNPECNAILTFSYTKDHPDYDIVVCDYIEKNFEKNLKNSINRFLKTQKTWFNDN